MFTEVWHIIRIILILLIIAIVASVAVYVAIALRSVSKYVNKDVSIFPFSDSEDYHWNVFRKTVLAIATGQPYPYYYSVENPFRLMIVGSIALFVAYVIMRMAILVRLFFG